MLNNTKLGTGIYYGLNKNNLMSNQKLENDGDTKFIEHECKLEYIIPLHKPNSQSLDVGIVNTKEFGIRGVVVKDDVVHILPVENIVSGLDNSDNGIGLIRKLSMRPPESWDLVYDQVKQLGRVLYKS